MALEPGLETALKNFNEWQWVDSELTRIERAGIRLITMLDPEYPLSLRSIPDPPLLLYSKGNISTLTAGEAVAIVGTRQPTHYGLQVSESLGRDLASMGLLIVSGMARGCDMAAHKGALGAEGSTVAVLGTGLDRCYPPEARELYKEIGEKGLLLSEFPLGTGPMPYNFPQRNRIISGLSRGVIVVEAPLRSGAMMTARLALRHNRDLFAVPGPLGAEKSKGPNSLIQGGALLVETASDILKRWGLEPVPLKNSKRAVGPDIGTVPAHGNEALVFKSLEAGPLSIDALAAVLGLKVQDLGGLLLEMELKGLITQGPGKIFTRRF